MSESPEQRIVEAAFEQFCEVFDQNNNKDVAFEKFVVDCLLRQKELEIEEIEEGITDGPLDGGIDAMYTFVNGARVSEEHPLLDPESRKMATKTIGQAPRIELHILQSKNVSSWKEGAVDKFALTFDELFDESKAFAPAKKRFNADLLRAANIYREASAQLRSSFPTFSVRVMYVTRGMEADIHDGLRAKGKQLEQAIQKHFPKDSEISFEFIGAETLYRESQQPRPTKLELRFEQGMIIESGAAYVCLTTIRDYLEFVHNSEGQLREALFAYNIRDFNGYNAVNKAIRDTLMRESLSEFWWQNNGITILSEHVLRKGTSLTIETPLIVNGLQTTRIIHETDAAGLIADSRSGEGVLVRIIESNDDTTRSPIIEGTNTQTQVPKASFLATQPEQRKIEDYFKSYGWYYERRKGQYKHLGKPQRRIVSIKNLAQCITTLWLGEPDYARARPSDSIEKAFARQTPPAACLKSVQLLASVNQFLTRNREDWKHVGGTNLRFYLLLGATMDHLQVSQFDQLKFPDRYSELPNDFDEELLWNTTETLDSLFESYFEQTEEDFALSYDQAAKSSTFRRFFLDCR